MPTKGSDNLFPKVVLSEGSTPSTPSTGQVKLYAKTDGLLYSLDDAAVETALGAAAHIADSADAHDASAISIVDSGAYFTATDVEAALQELGAGGGGGAAAFSGAKAYNSALQSISDVTLTALTLDSEEYDTDGYHSTSSNTSRMTIPSGKGGYFMVTASGYGASATLGFLALRKNGSTTLRGAYSRHSDAAEQSCAYAVAAPVALADGDYVEAVYYQDSSGSRDFGHDSVAEAQACVTITRLGD